MRLLILSVLCLIAVGSARRSYGPHDGGRPYPRPHPRPRPQTEVQDSRYDQPSCWIVCATPPPTTEPPPTTTKQPTTKIRPTRTTTKRPRSTPKTCSPRPTLPPPRPTRPTRTTTKRPPSTPKTCSPRPRPPPPRPTRPTRPTTTTTKRPPRPPRPPRPSCPTATTTIEPTPPVECTDPQIVIPGLDCLNVPQQGVKSFSLKYMQQIIVDQHNIYRNMVAEGYPLPDDDRLPSASHMGAVSWDKDLARLAKALLSGGTQPTGAAPLKYPNFGIVHSSFIHKPAQSAETVIIDGIKSWFDQLENLTEQIIVSYDGDDYCGHSSAIGFLAVILNERSTHIGCAAIQFCNDEGYQYTVMCAYSSRTIEEKSIFEIGPPASDCRVMDDEYAGLCATYEPYQY